MLRRTWPYGTQRSCRVVEVIREGQHTILACQEIDRPGEGHVLIHGRDAYPDVVPGQTGTLIFTEGGPTGAYWRLVPDAAAGT